MRKSDYVKKDPHLYDEGFPHSVVMPAYYQSKAEDVDFVRQSTKNPESKPEAKHRKNKAIRKAKMEKKPESEEEEYDSDEDFKHQHITTKAMIIAEKAKEAKELRDRLKLMKAKNGKGLYAGGSSGHGLGP